MPLYDIALAVFLSPTASIAQFIGLAPINPSPKPVINRVIINMIKLNVVCALKAYTTNNNIPLKVKPIMPKTTAGLGPFLSTIFPAYPLKRKVVTYCRLITTPAIMAL